MATATPAAPAALDAEAAIDLCRVLADPTRFALMAAIWRAEQCVCDLRSASGDRPQNLVSHHLGVLRRAGMVETRRDGHWIYYRPADRPSPGVAAALTALLGPRGDGASAACA